MKRPLEGLTVIDLSRLFPGGFCSLILADLGARIIKIEEPQVGDFYRQSEAGAIMGEGYFAALNRGKESLALDLKTKAGREVLLKLVARADIVLEGFRPGVLAKLGLSYQRLKQSNPKIILCSITGYGQSGPKAQDAGHDINYLSDTGLLALLGEGKVPGIQIADMAGGGLYGVIAILAALQQRSQTGKGTWVDVAMTEGALSLAGVHLTGDLWQQAMGQLPQQLLTGASASYRVYHTKDKQAVAIAALEDKFWAAFRKLAKGINLPANSFDPRLFQSIYHAKISKLFRQYTAKQWIKLSKQAEFCFSIVKRLSEVAKDPHFLQRQVFLFMKGPRDKLIPFIKSPLVFGKKRHYTAKSAPSFGQHSARILKELGYEAQKIRDYKRKGVIQ